MKYVNQTNLIVELQWTQCTHILADNNSICRGNITEKVPLSLFGE